MSSQAPAVTDGGQNRTDAVAQLRALHAITRASAQADNDDDLLRWTATAAQVALGAASVSIERFERENGVLRTLVNVGDLGPTERELPDDETYSLNEYASLEFVEAGGHGAVTTLDDCDPDPMEVELLQRLGKHSAVDVPIFLDGGVWGELYATRTADVPPFEHADLAFAEAVAAQVAAGIAQGAHARRLEALARLDPLTGLANRSAIEERLDEAIDAHLHGGPAVGVVICDVNGLKPVNDGLGHDAGDRLLSQTSELLSRTATALPGSLAGRIGGDEFALVVQGLDTDAMLPALRDLCQGARQLNHGSGLSCGLASTSDPIGHVGTSGDLLRLADAAQYRAKRGRASWPVVAGRSLAPEVAAALASGEDEPTGIEGRTVGRRPSDVTHHMVAEAVALLDRSRGATVLNRLATVGASVAGAIDAATWWVSVVPDGSDTLHPRCYGAARPPAAPGPDRSQFFEVDVVVPLAEFPDTVRVLAGGWFEQHVDDPDGDPAELAVLQEGGYRAVVGAGGTRAGEGWLLEVFADEHSPSMTGLGPTLRALVALALAEGAEGVESAEGPAWLAPASNG